MKSAHALWRWFAIALSCALVASCGGGDEEKSCPGTVYYGAYSYSPPDGEVGQPYSYTPNISISGCRPSDHVSSGSLPPGLGLDPGSGRISGTPSRGGSYTLTVRPNASGSVQSTFTINVYPIGPQVPTLTGQRMGSSFDLPPIGTQATVSLAAVDHGAGWRLYAANPRIIGNHIYTSADMGAHWTLVDRTGGPESVRGEFRYAAGARDLYVLDTGSYSSNEDPIVYRYDGAAWHTTTLPFRPAPGVGVGFHVDENDNMIVAWMGRPINVWRSSDRGANWTQVLANSWRTTSIYSHAPYACVGVAGDDIRLVVSDGYTASSLYSVMDMRLSPGATDWDDYSFWSAPSGLTTYGVDLASSCATVRGRLWIAMEAAPYPYPAYLALGGAGLGSGSLDFPQRVPSAPRMQAIARMGNDLVGLKHYIGGEPWQVWVLR